MHTSMVPEQGQIVTVRQRTYAVTEVRQSVIQSTQANTIFHLVNLSSVEDDALGESLQVIWEIEIGTQIIEKIELPEPKSFDDPSLLDSFLDAVRWGASSQADRSSLQAPFRSGVEVKDYQLNPLVRAIQMPRVSLLIADDVGLGKTVEAGLIVQEMMTRNRARTMLIVCPSGLQLHWRDQMRDKFGLEFRIVDSDSMRQLRRSRGIHLNPWSHFPRLITSMDFIKRERPLRLFRESIQNKPKYPRPFDMLILDEAHNVAPSGTGHYAVDSQRTTAIRTIIPYFEHHLFLSATPHNGYSESFSALLELLDNQRFARGVPPDRKQLEAVMVRRLKRDLINNVGQPQFQKRVIKTLEVEYHAEEVQAHTWLKEYGALRRERATTNEEKYASEFVLKLLKKRLLSSPEAFRTTLVQHLNTLSKPKQERVRDNKVMAGILRRQIAQVQEDYADDEEYEGANAGAVEVASKTFTPLTQQERALIEQMIAWAKTASERRDSKTKQLLSWLKSVLKPNGIWNDERVILFTEYRTTQKWLQQILTSEGLGDGNRLALIYGGMESEEREKIKNAFQAKPSAENKLRILLATDAASEGIDLQNHCHRLVHIEIPWNPNRMEQRNGRIDRMGQKQEPQIFHFVPSGYQNAMRRNQGVRSVNDLEGDLEFLMRAVEKVDQIRHDLMGKVGDVIAQQVEEAMLGFRRELDTTTIEDKTRPARALLRFEKDLDAKIQKQIDDFRVQRHKLRLTPEYVQKVVEVALSLAEQPALQRSSIEGAYVVPPLKGAWASAKEGLAHPFTQEERPIVFDEERMKDDSVVSHLNHPLVLLSQRLLRAEVWSPQGKLNRVTARIVPNHALKNPALVAYARLVVIGGGRYRLHEELITAGGWLTYGNRPSFRRMSVTELNEAMDNMTDQLPSKGVLESLPNHWETFAPSLKNALEVRKEDRTQGISKLLEERMNTELSDIQTVLEELASSIRKEISTPQAEQQMLPGFSTAEREQFERDIHNLHQRLARIPDEIRQEKHSIRSRYEGFQVRLFPVAITYLVPKHL